MTDMNIKRVHLNEEKILLGDAEYDLLWLCKPSTFEMEKAGAKKPPVSHSLVMHFDVKGDPAFMDRLRMAWQTSGLNQKYALDRHPPDVDPGNEGLGVPVYTAILEGIDEWAAGALKNQFVLGLQDTYPSQKPKTIAEKYELGSITDSVEELSKKAQAETADGEDEDEDKEPEPTFDPHGAGLQEIPDPEAEPEYDPHSAGLQEIPDNNEV